MGIQQCIETFDIDFGFDICLVSDPTAELSDEDEASDSDDEPVARFSFPELDRQIRQAISTYGAVFPKLNWTAPKACCTFSHLALGFPLTEAIIGCKLDAHI